MMMVEEKPDVTYNDVGGCKEQIEKLREANRSRELNMTSIKCGLVAKDMYLRGLHYCQVGRGDVVGYGFNLIELLRDYVILEVTDVSTASCQRDVNTASYNISVAWLQVCILLLLMGILEYLWIKSSLETDVKAAKWVPPTESNLRKTNVQCYNCNAKGHYACNCPKPKVRDAKYYREQMLLAIKDEAGGNLNGEENNFMLDNAYEDDTLEEQTTAIIMMTHIQPVDDKGDVKPKYDAEAISEENALQISLISRMLSKETINIKTPRMNINLDWEALIPSCYTRLIIQNVFFYFYLHGSNYKILVNTEREGPRVKIDEHDSNAHDQSFDIESLVYNVKKEAMVLFDCRKDFNKKFYNSLGSVPNRCSVV
uniref:MSS1-like protein n=1 Tax=Tanacetum cinerariifolium TaxID=118510 RepID=A0A6L2JVP3_TANCI|nr:MSS1-like protein [Tanacetum cinerariifolium]